MKERILIIKLGSMGDVLRTTPLLAGFKKIFAKSHITWLTYEDSINLLEGNRLIDRILCFGLNDILRLQAEEFGILINLDKDDKALALTSLIRSKKKKGFGMDQEGNIIPLNTEAEYSVRLGLDDDLKFRENKKTYPEIIFEAAGIPYCREFEYILDLPKDSCLFAEKFFKEKLINSLEVLIGINTGAGGKFANKNLSAQRIAELINKLSEKLTAKIILLGGPSEIAINKKIKSLVNREVVDSGYVDIKKFAALVNRCNLIISADTLAMHIAIALKRPTVALFGPTCAQEIELYNRGEKIVSTIQCAPCYKNRCDKKPNCMDTIDLDEVCAKARDLLIKFAPNDLRPVYSKAEKNL